jgi:hypothetical protein
MRFSIYVLLKKHKILSSDIRIIYAETNDLALDEIKMFWNFKIVFYILL